MMIDKSTKVDIAGFRRLLATVSYLDVEQYRKTTTLDIQ